MTGGNDVRAAIREFLPTRRARLTPERAGLPGYGGNRRVPGLRREEDVDYYRGGTQPFHHPVVGDLTLDDAVLELPADPGTDDRRLHRRTRHTGAARTRPAGQLDLDAGPGAGRTTDHDT